MDLEEKIKQNSALPKDQIRNLRENLAGKEADFMRLRRIKMAASDFTTVKVIGKGAFGEVSLRQIWTFPVFNFNLRFA